jgi:hypothetical protein
MFHLPMRRARRLIACLIFELLMFWVPCVTGQSIKLRLVNAKSGKPLSKTNAAMCMWDGTFDIHRPAYPARVCVTAITDKSGTAVFQLAMPPPEHIGFDIGGLRDFAGCWRLPGISPENVLRSGLVAAYSEECGQLRAPLTVRPGEVVIADRQLSLWEKMRTEIP